MTQKTSLEAAITPCPKCNHDYNNDTHKIMRLIQGFNERTGLGLGMGHTPPKDMENVLDAFEYHLKAERKAAHAASLREPLGNEGWREITEPLAYGNYIVTNNPHARTNDDKIMSHCWHTNMVHWDKENKEYTCFYGLNMAKVHGLKMFMPVPLPSPPSTKPEEKE